MTDAPWHEIYEGGSPAAEAAIFARLAEDMLAIQTRNQHSAGAGCPARALHAKAVAATARAELVMDADLPPAWASAPFRAGARIPASVRFSNASGVPQPDAAPDMRGVAIRLALPDGGTHDLLMTNAPVSHARDARQFVTFAMLAAGDRATLSARLVEAFGAGEAARIGANLKAGIRACASLAGERFWSRGAILWNGQPVRYDLRPVEAPAAPFAAADGADGLHEDLARRLAAGPVAYRFALQPFVDAARTPIEDAAIAWQESDSPPVEIATLVLHRQDLDDAEGRAAAAAIEAMAFNPWNAPAAFRPLGNINRARGVVYGRSAEVWQAARPA